MNATLELVRKSKLFDRYDHTRLVGTFSNYRLELAAGTTFDVVCFLPNITQARETLTRIEVDGQVLFLSKDHLGGQGQLMFLAQIDARWVIYRLIGLPRNPQVDLVWVVTEEGVHYPLTHDQNHDFAEAISLKYLIAEQEVCTVVCIDAEQAFLVDCERQATFEARRQREAAANAAAEARRQAEVKKAAAAEARRQAKQRLQAPGNRRYFVSSAGMQMFGYIVANQETAKQLDHGKIAVILSEDGHRVVSAFMVNKKAGGQVSFAEVVLAEVNRTATAADPDSKQQSAVALTKFDTFIRCEAKRQEGDKPLVAYYATERQFQILKTHRPESPVVIAVQLGDQQLYQVYRIGRDEFRDLGRMVCYVALRAPEKTPASSVSLPVATNGPRRFRSV